MPAPDFASEMAALEAGMASGEATIESDGERVTYRSVRDIRDALAYFRNRAAAAMSPMTRGGTSLARFDRD